MIRYPFIFEDKKESSKWLKLGLKEAAPRKLLITG
jgi:hypothetical protein